MREGKKTKIKGKERRREQKDSKFEKQTRLVVFLMVFVVFVVFLIYFLIQESKKFEYSGLKFEKGKQGDLILYYSQLPLPDVTGRVIGYLPFYLREDPRKLERIGIDGRIEVKKTVILSANPDIFKCEDSVLAATTLSLNLGKLGLKTVGATTNKTYAKEANITLANCFDVDSYTTILVFKEGEESRISRVMGNCYILDIANCEIMNVTERFMLGLYANIIGVE